MAVFETACAANGIRRFVLPPKSPKLNGAVERADGALRGLTPAAYLHSLTTQETSVSH
jgi:hypothetical protein